jgi:hypothetical protein
MRGILLGLVLLAFGWLVRVDRIEGMLPYCQHPDEHVWVSKALGMVRTGDLNPRRFTKPSVMVYLNAATLALTSAASSDPALAPRKLPKSCYPYFEDGGLILPLRYVYAVASLMALLLAALVSRKLARHLLRPPDGAPASREPARRPLLSPADAAFLLTIALGLGSPFYLRLSTWYLNVDILGCLTAMAVIAHATLLTGRLPARSFALTGGVLAGICVGTKYNLFPVLAAPTLAILFLHRRNWLVNLTLLGAAALAAFFVTTPYALLTPDAFYRDLAHEAAHYALGEASPTRERGLEMFLAYGKNISDGFGWSVLLLALVGLVESWRRNWRLTSIAFSYPLLLWLYMSLQRTFFARNLLILELAVPMLAALGTFELVQAIGWKVRGSRLHPTLVRTVAFSCLVALVLAAWPVEARKAAFAAHPESRNHAVAWVLKHARRKSTVLVARELNMDVRRLKERFRVVPFKASKKSLDQLRRDHRGAVAIVPVIDNPRGGTVVPKDKQLFRAGRIPVRARDLPRKAPQKALSGDPKLVVVRL